jgi:hypothetical protein
MVGLYNLTVVVELKEAMESAVVELELTSKWKSFAVVQPCELLYYKPRDSWAKDVVAAENQEVAGVVNGHPFRQSHPSS